MCILTLTQYIYAITRFDSDDLPDVIVLQSLLLAYFIFVYLIYS